MVRARSLSLLTKPDVGLDGAMHDAVPAVAALGVSPIVRLPDMQGWMVKRKIYIDILK